MGMNMFSRGNWTGGFTYNLTISPYWFILCNKVACYLMAGRNHSSDSDTFNYGPPEQLNPSN